MDGYILVLQIIGIILSLILCFGIPAYLKKKGENLATQEDIGKITEEVKKVESMFSISTSSEIDYNTMKRKEIFEYFNILNTYSSLILSSLIEHKEDRLFENKKLFEKIKNSYMEYSIKDESMLLFFSIEDFSVISANTSASLKPILKNLQQLFEDIENQYIINKSDKSIANKNIEDLIKNYYINITEYYKTYIHHKDILVKFLDNEIRNTFTKQGA
ncbi:hypothetical protein BAY06_03955 [Elizabethkingia anophelis]|uniref:hypothetical protein n=1 Tax=Elizabethkingia anophelis TaxID=1117645 RepID=UPI0009996451|nr:hypothetical protein [Elizabethkingia anophelis]OPC51491.1 hypothetical protein BAY06_03955 [Elizabethkingia anophelis]